VKPHLVAQQAIVRMLFDPAFAARVRSDAAAVLPELPSTLRAQLAAIDPRALKLDRLLRRRVLRTLFDEYKASTTLYLARARKLAALDEFFSSPFFALVFEGCPLAFAYPGFLMKDEDAPFAAVVSIELGLARARRQVALVPDGRVHRAPGVQPIATTQGALATLQQAEQYLFEVGLMPAVALCADAPPLELDARAHDRTPLHLVTVPTDSGHSLVTIDEPTYQLLVSLPAQPACALQPLVDDEIAVQT
jgi:hypothetical protein